MMRLAAIAAGALLLLWPVGRATGQSTPNPAAQAQDSMGAPGVPARQWASDAAANEVKVLEYERSYLRYTMHQVDAKGDQVREVVESKDGTVARLMMKENRPLTPEEDAAEHERLQAMLDDPAAFAKHVKNDRTGKRFAVDLIKLMPDAMIFTYTPGQPQRARSAGQGDAAPEIVIDFKPNPNWKPPTMTSEALTGFEGRIWIDAKTHHLTRLEGDVFRGVNFGFGIFAHIFPGGKVTFEQTNVTDQRWIFTHFVQHVQVRVVFKTITQNSEIQGTNFSPVAEMSYQDAIHLLLASPLPGH